METKLNKDKNLPLYFNDSAPLLSSTPLLQSMQNQKNIPLTSFEARPALNEKGVYH